MSFIKTCDHAMNNVWGTLTTYQKELPSNIPKEMFKSFFVGFIVGTVFSGDPVIGLAWGSVNAVATAVHSFVTPFLKNQFQWGDELTTLQEWGRRCVTLVCCATLFYPIVGSFALNCLLADSIFHGVAVALFDGRRSTKEAMWMY